MMHGSLEAAFVKGQSAARSVSMGNAATTLIAPKNDKRIAIHIWAPPANALMVNTEGAASATDGFNVLAGEGWHCVQSHYGDYATREFNGFVNAAGTSVFVVEVLACPCATGH